MRALFSRIKSVARVLYLVTAWVFVAFIFVQVFHAGYALLVETGNWSRHVNFGHVIVLPVMAMIPLSLIGWIHWRHPVLSILLFGLYTLQYIFLYGVEGSARALHPVNALVIFYTATHVAQHAWRHVSGEWRHGPAWRVPALLAIVAVSVVAIVGNLLSSGGTWGFEEGDGDRTAGAKAAVLAAASEADIPEQYRALQNPFAASDQAAVAAGQVIAHKRCISCHAADLKGKDLGGTRSADLTRSAGERTDQFLMWAVSEGSGKGMPAWKNGLSEEERWQVVTFIRSQKP